MAFTDTPDSSLSTLTDIGRSQLARCTMGEISIQARGFSVGREGYVQSNPVKISNLDGSVTSLGDQIFPLSGYKPFESIELPHPKTLVLNCRLAQTEAIAGLGELGIWAEIIDSNNSTEIGTKFLLAIAHFPIITKNNQQVSVSRVVVQF